MFKVNVNYIGSFSDVALASEAATTHISAGADVLTGTAQMVVGAIGKAEEANALWFGTQSNQSSLAPSIVVASQVYHWEVVLNEMIGLIKAARSADSPSSRPCQWRRSRSNSTRTMPFPMMPRLWPNNHSRDH